MGLAKNENDLILLGEANFVDTSTNTNYLSTTGCDCSNRLEDFFIGQSNWSKTNRLEYHVYDESGNVKIASSISVAESIQDPDPTIPNDSYRLKVDIDEDLRRVGITQGAFHCKYYYLRPVLEFVIEQISPSRKEIRVRPKNTSIAPVSWDVQGYYCLLQHPSVSNNGNHNELIANFGDDQYETIVNWTTNAQASGIPDPNCEQITRYLKGDGDAFKGSPAGDPVKELPANFEPGAPTNTLWSTMVLKLYNPLPDNIVAHTVFNLDVPIIDPFIRDVILLPEKKEPKGRKLRVPNWDIQLTKNNQQQTNRENRDSLLGSVNEVKTQLINKFLSGSSGVDLNYDFKYFDNFIHFSSAEERLQNFYYKAKKIEGYDSSIASLTTGLPAVSASLSASAEYQNNVIKFRAQKDALIGTFDQYENYLYYESSSRGSSSFDTTGWDSTSWPKSGSVKTYPLFSYSSSAVIDWYGSVGSKTGMIYSASLYDRMNGDELVKTVPAHIREDKYNDFYDLFVKMCGQHFDTLYFYTKNLSTLIDRNESLDIGMPKALIYNVLQGLGWNPTNGMQFDDLWKAALGTDDSGSFHVTSSFSVSQSINYVVSESTPREEISQEIWKRILNNLPYLLKTKGSWEAVRALINCYGIPSTMLDIKEYGGPNKLNNPSYFKHDKFDYSLHFNAFSGSYVEIGSSNSALTTTSRTQDAIEFRFKTTDASALKATLSTSQSMQILASKGSSDKNAIRIVQTGSTAEWGVIEQVMEKGTTGIYVTQSIGPVPIFNGNWWTVLYQRLSGSNSDTIDQTYEMYLKQEDFGKITQNHSGSWIISGSIGATTAASQSNNILRNTTKTYYGSGDLLHGFPLTGSMQEIRLWGTALSESNFDSHVLSPLTYVGNNLTASYNDLYARYMLGTDVKKWDRTEYRFISSSQPNQSITTFTDGASLAATASLFLSGSNNSYHPNEEVVHQIWPDSSGNRSISNKIRVESTQLIGNLSLDKRAELASYDKYPSDSSKIGVYFSPTNEINQDIAEQMGGFNIDDYIGDPRLQYSQSYDDLRVLRNDYFKKYKTQGLITDFDSIVNDNKYSYVEYLRLIKFFDTSLFKQIEYLLPARSNPLLGVVIEPHVLERNKQTVLTTQPSFSFSRIEADLLNEPGFTGVIPDSYVKQGSTLWTIATSLGELIEPPSLTGSFRDYSSSILENTATSGALVQGATASLEVKDWALGTGTYFEQFREITASVAAYTGSHPNLFGLAKTSSYGASQTLPQYYLSTNFLQPIAVTVTGSRLSTEFYKKIGFMTESIGTNFTIYECDYSASIDAYQSSSYEFAEYQDFISIGQYRSFYEGSKISSPDWNRAAQNADEGTVNLVGQQDTPDGKAVVEIFYTNPNRLFYSPGQEGNMKVGAPDTKTGFTFLGGQQGRDDAINYNRP